VTRLALGAIDLTVDVDAEPDGPIVAAHAMAQLVLASRATRIARVSGFGGKMCIHPAQPAPTRAAFLPTEEQITWAAGIVAEIDTTGEAAVHIEGQMIDKPVVDRARTILRRAGRAP
jgi:citrate lyase subunit beta/citryl-CoA lyase